MLILEKFRDHPCISDFSRQYLPEDTRWQASRNGKKNLKNSWSAHKWYSRFGSHQKSAFTIQSQDPAWNQCSEWVVNIRREKQPWFSLNCLWSAVQYLTIHWWTKMPKEYRLRTGSICNVNVGKGRIPGSYGCLVARRRSEYFKRSWRKLLRDSELVARRANVPRLNTTSLCITRADSEVDKAMKTMVQSGFEPETFCV